MAMHRRKVRPVVVRLGLAVVVLAVLAGLGAWTGITLLSIRDDLTGVQYDLRAGAEAASAGDVEQAAAMFASASERAGGTVQQVHSPPVQLVGLLPVVGSTADSLVAVSEAAHLIAIAGEEVLGTLASVPGGLDSLTVGGDDGAWLETVDSLTEPLTAAATNLDLARRLVEAAPIETRVREVDEARAQLITELDAIVPAVHDATALMEVLPSLFGKDGEQRYFLGAQNPAELRGTGGLIGAYAIMSIEDGAVDIGSFSPVQELQKDVFTEDISPNEDFFRRYSPWITGVGTWLNVNMSPDFPAVAQTIRGMYLASEAENIDGVIVVDPFALEAMLRATGPVTSPDPDIGTLEADTVVEYITTVAPVQLGVGGERKEILGEAARVILSHFLSGEVGGRARLGALAEAVAGGHLLVHAADPLVQERLIEVGASGSLPSPEPPTLALAIANLAESKADVWLKREVEWNISLEPNGAALAVVTITLSNTAPANPEIPQYILGPGGDQTIGRGGSLSLTSVYCGTCLVQDTEYTDSREFGAWIDTEGGHNVVSTQVLIPRGETRVIQHVVRLEDGWNRSGGVGVFAPQFWTPASIQGTSLSVSVQPPPGWMIEARRTPLTSSADGETSFEVEDARYLQMEFGLSQTP